MEVQSWALLQASAKALAYWGMLSLNAAQGYVVIAIGVGLFVVAGKLAAIPYARRRFRRPAREPSGSENGRMVPSR
jgi:hypothetical protein